MPDEQQQQERSHLSSSFDPWQQEMRNAVQSNSTRIAEITAERKAEIASIKAQMHADSQGIIAARLFGGS